MITSRNCQEIGLFFLLWIYYLDLVVIRNTISIFEALTMINDLNPHFLSIFLNSAFSYLFSLFFVQFINHPLYTQKSGISSRRLSIKHQKGSVKGLFCFCGSCGFNFSYCSNFYLSCILCFFF